MHHYHHSACAPGCLEPSANAQSSTQKVRLLWTALILITAFAIVELAVSISSHSLALLAESGHMLSDGLALGLALCASWIAQLPASKQATFGYRRVEILAALMNGIGLMAVALWIAWESIMRLQSPPADEILSLPMLITATVGLLVNSLNASLLHQHSHQDLNLKGAFLHMVADAMSSVGVILAAIAVWAFHWTWADSAISLVVAGFIGVGTLPLIGQSLNILLEKAPSYLNPDQIQAHLAGFAGVKSVNQLRVWTIALGQVALSAHILVDSRDGSQRDRLLHQIQTSLQQEFGIQEIFLQMMNPSPPITVNLSRPETLEALRLRSRSC